MNSGDACKTCEMTVRRRLGQAPLWDNIYQTEFWDVVHAYNSALPGWLVLVVQRHIESLDELTEQEAAELGPLIRRVSLSLKSVIGCKKTYVIQFAEPENTRTCISISYHAWLINLPSDEVLESWAIWESLGTSVSAKIE